jgi:hypothetical protein
MLKLAIPLLSFLLSFLLPINLVAQEVIIYKGQKGFFFTEEAGTKILQDLEAYNGQKHEISLLKDQITLKLEKIDNLNLDISLADQQIDKYKQVYILEHDLRLKDQDHYETIIKKKSAWYTHPIFWFSMGFIVASGFAIGLSFSLQEVR